jgi:hypothetical protein
MEELQTASEYKILGKRSRTDKAINEFELLVNSAGISKV